MWDPCPQYHPAKWRHPSWVQGSDCLYGKTCLKIEDRDDRELDFTGEPDYDQTWYYNDTDPDTAAEWSSRIQYPGVFTVIGDVDTTLDWECADIAGNGGDVIQIKWWQKSDSIAIGNKSINYGIGFDVHRLVSKRKLYLGGIKIPSNVGTLGHSDGDPVLHAISDSILGACKMGDIGEKFSDKNK